jgi:hypothetical protein
VTAILTLILIVTVIVTVTDEVVRGVHLEDRMDQAVEYVVGEGG